MSRFLIRHRHEAPECGAVFAAFKGHESPLRHQATIASCAFGGHSIWWAVEAATEVDALGLLPFLRGPALHGDQGRRGRHPLTPLDRRTPMSSTHGNSPHRPPWAAILVVPLVVALVLTLFAWPSARLEPRDLPIGVAGPPVAAEPIAKRLAKREGAFDLHRYRDEAAAREAIEDREIYGAFVATPTGAMVLTASAASPAVAQLLTRAASESGASTRDVVEAGPRAPALASSVLPLVIAGILTGVAGALMALSALGRAGLVALGSVLTGLAATAIVHGWLDVVEGDWLANAGVLSLTVLAIGSILAGLYALIGKAGLIVGALTMIFIGNPFSGVGSAPELLPQPVGAIGQLLPPGAGGNLLRSTGFFDGAGAGTHLIVLAAWALMGLVFLMADALRSRGQVATGDSEQRRPAEVVESGPVAG